MPYVNNEISKKLTKTEKEEIKKGIGRILEEEIDKPEKVLMVKISDENEIWFSGKQGEYAFIELKLLGKLELESKNRLSLRIVQLYKEVIGIEDNCIYITFDQYERSDWGYKGKTFA